MVLVNCIGSFIQEFEMEKGSTIGELRKKVEEFKPMMSQMREISFLFCGSLLADDIHLSDLPMTSRDHIILVTGPKKEVKKESTNSNPQESAVDAQIQNIMSLFGETRVSESPQAPRPTPVNQDLQNRDNEQPESNITPQQADLNILVEAGFPVLRAQKALILNRMDVNLAMEWLVDHIDDPNVDAPLTEEELQRHLGIDLTPSEEIKNCINSLVCTYCVTGPLMTPQPWFECVTCGLVGDKGCCATCSRVCHEGHEVITRGNSSCFCDCESNCKAKSSNERR